MIYLLPVDHLPPNNIPVNESNVDLEEYFLRHFSRDYASVTISGRSAISLIMNHLKLQRADEVLILTTFDFPNVSSCVTSTIFNYCKPARVLSRHTRAILVIHEFGVPYTDMDYVLQLSRSRGIPVIEDCAHTIDSIGSGYRVGTIGDWVICSLPKIFPVRFGGILLGTPIDYNPNRFQKQKIITLSQDIALYLDDIFAISEIRRENYKTLTELTIPMGLHPLFEVNESISPWFFPIAVPDVERTAEAAMSLGVEYGLWHGTNIIVFPCHQYLNDEHIFQIANVISHGLNSNL